MLSGCRTATGRLEADDGFVGLTWGFLFAGADSVIASLWKVDDAATTLLMTRLYENLLGVYEEPRWKFPAGTEMPKAEALHEAKRWLKSRTPKQNRDLLALGFDVAGLDARYRAERGRRKPSQDPQPLADPFDYSHPRYWNAFILIGAPG
ncbi:MAG: CHAT domain-containing protein [Planctomycetes bacterium]|nr:CHAT domain-containing protein [Planctomycetota bacterium]